MVATEYMVTMPPTEMRQSIHLMDYAPDDPCALSGWLDALPFGQMETVWPGVMAEALHQDGSVHALCAAVDVVRNRYRQERQIGRVSASKWAAKARELAPSSGDWFFVCDHYSKWCVRNVVKLLKATGEFDIKKQARSGAPPTIIAIRRSKDSKPTPEVGVTDKYVAAAKAAAPEVGDVIELRRLVNGAPKSVHYAALKLKASGLFRLDKQKRLNPDGKTGCRIWVAERIKL